MPDDISAVLPGLHRETDDAQAYIRSIFHREMGVTLHNYRAGSSRDEAMRNLTKEAANLYAKRVLRELIQNAFDGASDAADVRILLRLDLKAGEYGTLYVANNGRGFTRDNVDAVVSPAMSNKTPGNFIGHKGLGFRSVELLSDDVQIYSILGRVSDSKTTFDGYCFRFADADDERNWLAQEDALADAPAVVGRVHRLQLPLPIDTAPSDVASYAGEGYATVIKLPLRDADAAASAAEELRLLFDGSAPIALFLHRLSALTIERVDFEGKSTRQSLSRQARPYPIPSLGEAIHVEEVEADQKRFLVARMQTDEARFRKSVEESVARRHPVERWADWTGSPTVSIALPLKGDADAGVYYAFLPMERRAPFSGCLDAPFYPAANRRDLDLTVPLNAFLLDEIATLCLGLSNGLADGGETRSELSMAAIDAIAWTDETERLIAACGQAGVEVGAVRLPAMRRSDVDDRWAALSEIYDWKEDVHSYLSRNLMVRVCALPMLPRLGKLRLEAVQTLANVAGIGLYPAASSWKDWAPKIALDLAKRRKLVRSDWETFYADLASLPDALPHLRGQRIFRLEDGSLAPANSQDSDGYELFVSVGQETRRRTRIGSTTRVPPSSIVKKMRFADPQLHWPATTAGPFFQAQLATEYNLPRVMAKLGRLMGRKPKRATAIAALGWAFEAWRSNRTPELDQAIKLANLLVPVSAGALKPAGQSWFSTGWRDTRGDLLSQFLEASPEGAKTLRVLRDGLLEPWDDWPLKDRGAMAEWVLFLRQLGARDGLQPTAYNALTRSVWDWTQFMSTDAGGPNVLATFGSWWRKASATTSPWNHFRYQSGEYEASPLSALPGQAEYGQFSTGARLLYARLIVLTLAELPEAHFKTTFRRTSGNSDYHFGVSPLGAFLQQAAWLPVGVADDLQWRRPTNAWHAPRADSLPRFVPAIERSVRDIIDGSKAVLEALAGRLGLLGWNDPSSASRRLSALGRFLSDGVAESEYDAFRKACREAWEDWASVTPLQALPPTLTLVVLSQGKPRALPLSSDPRPAVFLSNGADPMREQLVSALGHYVLPLPVKIIDVAAKALRARYGDSFPLLSEADLRIRCDGRDLSLNDQTQLLAGPGREWLAEIAVLVLEFNEGLSSRNTSRTRQSLYDDFRKLRIQFASRVEVELDGRTGDLPDVLENVLAAPDDAFPTVIVQAISPTIDWPLIGQISRALPLALRRPSLEFPLRVAFLEMARVQTDSILRKPSDDEVARALGQPLIRVQEIYRALRSTSQRLFETLAPVAWVLLGPEVAEALRAQQDRLLEDQQVFSVLTSNGGDQTLARNLLEACRVGDTLDEVRRSLGIDLARFNTALVALGAPWVPLTFEARLREQYGKRKEGRRSELEQRIRDGYVDAFDAGDNLELYRRARTLDWATFDETWSDRLDGLPDETADDRIDRQLAGNLPISTGRCDETLDSVRESNRVFLVSRIETVRRLVAAWCTKRGQAIGTPWSSTQEEVLRTAVSSGALDFRSMSDATLAETLRRAGLWPPEMPVTTDLKALGISQDDLNRRAREEEEAQRELEKTRRSIRFGDVQIDGGAERPLHLVAETLHDSLGSKGFTHRSGKADLMAFKDGGGGGKPGSRTPKRTREPEYMTEEQRVLVGFAAEYAAYRYLKRTVRNFPDAAWLSSMGTRFLGLPAGGDDDGFDFHVPRSKGPDLYYEVKGHRGDPGYVDLERSQVAAALSMASGRTGVWSILYVPFATSPDLITVLELQNPFAEASRQLYREVGKKAVRLEMRRAPVETGDNEAE